MQLLTDISFLVGVLVLIATWVAALTLITRSTPAPRPTAVKPDQASQDRRPALAGASSS